MTYTLSRKLNLALISKDVYPFETEDITITGEDFKAMQAEMESLVRDRTAYHVDRAKDILQDRARIYASTASDAESVTVTPVSPTAPNPSVTTSPPADLA